MLLFLSIFVLLVNSGTSYHYRGSMISWRILNATSSTNVVVEIFQRHAWDYVKYTPLCNDSTIPNKQPILGSGSIVCVSTCPSGLTTVGSVAVPCTGYSISEAYAAGEGRFTFTVKKNVSFVATFSGSGWFQLVVGTNAIWSVAVQIQIYQRSNGRYNNAPVVTMLPVYRLRTFKTYVIKINVADNDFDPYLCLWSNGTTQCGNLTNNVPGATINSTDCYLTFTPQIAGYYAVALTIEDFETATSPLSAYLSQVPIQFVFHVYNSTNPCWTGPIYVGDLPTDMCIYLEANTTFTTRIRLQVQCSNATVTNILSVNPTGLTSTNLVQDPYDKTIFIYFVTYFATAVQFGQNLYCFSGVDSVGNQGASACLRFIVQSPSVLLNPLYTQNFTHYPIGTVGSTTSTWTILTGGVQYTRPTLESYIRFKRLSDNKDIYRLNVVAEISNVLYLSDRLVITTNVLWTSGERYYIYFDSGVLALASTCTTPSMPIVDPTFWPFDIPFQTTVTTTSSTTTTSVTTTLRSRTAPTLRSITTKTSTTMTTQTASTYITSSFTPFTSKPTTKGPNSLNVGEITAISLSALLVLALLSVVIYHYVATYLIHLLLVRKGLEQQMFSFHTHSHCHFNELDQLPHPPVQYKLANNRRTNKYKYDKSNRSTLSTSCKSETTLVEVNI